jgi:hypothetical protein
MDWIELALEAASLLALVVVAWRLLRRPQRLLVAVGRDVYVGRTRASRRSAVVTLAGARQLLHWDTDGRGFCGLARDGITKHCRVSPVVPSITLRNVTATLPVAPKAAATWETV